MPSKDTKQAIKRCAEIENTFSIKIDCLALQEDDLRDLIKMNNLTITTMLSRRIILSGQEEFFRIMGLLMNENRFSSKEYSLDDLNESDSDSDGEKR